MLKRILLPSAEVIYVTLLVAGLLSFTSLIALQTSGPFATNKIKTPSQTAQIAARGAASETISDLLLPVSKSSLSKPDEAAQARISEAYGRLPLSFEANKGQTDSQVKFISRGN